MPRFGWRLWASALAVLVWHAAAAAADAPQARAALLAGLCSEDAAGAPDTIRQLLQSVPDTAPAERLWAQRVAADFAGRRVRCAEDGAFLVAGGGAVDAATLAPADMPAGLRAPLPSLRTRALLEQLTAALTLFTAPNAADRLAAAHALERRSDGLPPGLPARALASEHDPQVVASLRGLIVAAGLHAPDPGAAAGSDRSARQRPERAGGGAIGVIAGRPGFLGRSAGGGGPRHGAGACAVLGARRGLAVAGV